MTPSADLLYTRPRRGTGRDGDVLRSNHLPDSHRTRHKIDLYVYVIKIRNFVILNRLPGWFNLVLEIWVLVKDPRTPRQGDRPIPSWPLSGTCISPLFLISTTLSNDNCALTIPRWDSVPSRSSVLYQSRSIQGSYDPVPGPRVRMTQ